MHPSINASSQNYTAEEIQEYLAMLQRETTMIFIPALVFQFLLVIAGSVGNTLVLIIHSTKMTKTPFRIFVLSMAIFDLYTNVFSIPGDIYDMFHKWDSNMPVLCRIRRYIDSTFTILSFLILVVIGATRYTMICKPHMKRMTISQAKFASAMTLLVSAIISIPYGLIHGSKTKPTPHPSIVGHYCSIDDTYVDTVWPKVNSLFLVCISVLCCVLLAWFYISIGYTTWNHKKRLRYMRQNCFTLSSKIKVSAFSNMTLEDGMNTRIPLENGKSHLNSCQGVQDSPELNLTTEVRSVSPISPHMNKSLASSETTLLSTEGENSKVRQGTLREKNLQQTSDEMKDSKLGRTSWMMIVITLSFVLALIPFLALNFYKAIAPASYAALKGVPKAMYQLFVRSCFLNSVTNPIIYCLMDRKFRRELLNYFNMCVPICKREA